MPKSVSVRVLITLGLISARSLSTIRGRTVAGDTKARVPTALELALAKPYCNKIISMSKVCEA